MKSVISIAYADITWWELNVIGIDITSQQMKFGEVFTGICLFTGEEVPPGHGTWVHIPFPQTWNLGTYHSDMGPTPTSTDIYWLPPKHTRVG